MKPLFITNTARGGSYLTSQILSTNPDVTIASEPFLELFRSLRNSILSQATPEFYSNDRLTSLPFLDYYYQNNGVNIIDHVNNSSIDVKCTKQEWDRVYALQMKRLELQCKELIPTFHEMEGSNYLEIFNKSFELIRKSRSLPEQKWIGIKDAWIIELFFPLARSYPDAKFIVVLRDPRASISSNLLVKNKNMVAHVASFARAWRKNVAYSVYLRNQPEFKGRLHFVSYEKLVTDPEVEVRKVCDFLEIEYTEDMLDTSKFIDYATGSVWKGNSSYEAETKGISPHRIDRWKEALPKNALAAVEYICGQDLKLIDREPSSDFNLDKLSPEALDFFIKDNDGYKDWRTDSENPEMEYGFESARNTMISNPFNGYSDMQIRKSFLFKDVYDELIKNNPVSLFD